MASFKEMQTIKDKVHYLLVKREDSRDSDNLLISLIWYYENKLEINTGLSAGSFLEMYAKGRLTSAESIRRVRQKIQEQEPALRGKSYKARKTEEIVVQQNISEL